MRSVLATESLGALVRPGAKPDVIHDQIHLSVEQALGACLAFRRSLKE